MDQDRIWTELMDKNCVIFVIKKLYCDKCLDFIQTWILFFKSFGLQLDLDWVLKIQDWIWMAEYDSPLISAMKL